MAVSLTTISAIAARKGNEWLHEQTNLKSQMLGKNVLKKEKCDKQIRVINAQSGGLGSVSIMTGGSAYPTAESQEATQLMSRPVSFVGHVSIPYDSAELVSGKADSVKLVRNHFDMLGKNLSQNLGRALFDGYLGGAEAQATITAQAATVSVSDITGFRVNQIVDIYAAGDTDTTSSPTKTGSGRVASVTRDGDGTGSVSLTGLVNSSGAALTGNIAISSGFWIQGFLQPAAGLRFTSLKHICGSGDLYGTTLSDADWSGNEINAGGALSLDLMRELCDEVGQRSGEDPTVTVMHRIAFQDYEALSVSNVRHIHGKALDPYGKNDLMPEFRGRPLVVDDNCPGRQVFTFSQDALELSVWKEFGPLTNGKDVAEISQTNYAYLIKVAGMYNLSVERRNAVGRLHSITIS